MWLSYAELTAAELCRASPARWGLDVDTSRGPLVALSTSGTPDTHSTSFHLLCRESIGCSCGVPGWGVPGGRNHVLHLLRKNRYRARQFIASQKQDKWSEDRESNMSRWQWVFHPLDRKIKGVSQQTLHRWGVSRSCFHECGLPSILDLYGFIIYIIYSWCFPARYVRWSKGKPHTYFAYHTCVYYLDWSWL